ncbi:MAG: cardiolipin synthase [Phocaeicola sp.]
MENWGINIELFPVAFNFIYSIIIGITIGLVVLENRNPVKTMAWILVLLSVPVVGFILYLFLGRSKRRERLLNRKGFTQLMKRPLLAYQSQESNKIVQKFPPLLTFFRRCSHSFPFEGNKVEIYSDGETMFLALLKELNRAKHHIHLEFYIFENDALGQLMRDILIDKARQGVKVRLLYDDVGCWNVSQSFFEKMRENGVKVAPFLEVRFPQFTSKMNYRNHRKLIIIDGRVSFTGGINIANRYYKGVNQGRWRDTLLRIEGKATYGIQTIFLTDWYITTHKLIDSACYFPAIQRMGDKLVQVVISEPIGKWRTILQGLLQIIGSARDYVYIETPYLLPTDSLLVALQTAALSGVDVRIMMPQHSDSKLVQWASFSYVDSLLTAGVKIYFYTEGFLHSKLWVVDDSLVSIGSTNLDFRSLEHNFEANAFVYDETFAKEVRAIFLKDQKTAMRIVRKEWKKRPPLQKITESMVRLLAPLL